MQRLCAARRPSIANTGLKATTGQKPGLERNGVAILPRMSKNPVMMLEHIMATEESTMNWDINRKDNCR